MTYKRLFGTMSILLGMLVVPLFGQTGLSISLFEYPEPIVFSKPKDFEKGVSSNLSFLASKSFGDDHDNHGNNNEQWELSIIAEGNLSSGYHSIPISSIWAKSKNNKYCKSTGKVYLSDKNQIIARGKPGRSNSKEFFIEIELNAYDGEQFLKPTGEYSTYLYFTLTMD
jgi:hypothetical protein